MENEKIQQLLKARSLVDRDLDTMRTPITILFSDIKGSTPYFEKKGDVEGLAMVQRHHKLLIPIIEKSGGRVVKTIGDAIMASFRDPVAAVTTAISMQRALEEDRRSHEEENQIHIRMGLHTGLGLVKDNDIYGDVVNAASRVQHQAQPGQILITDALIPAARIAGVQVAKMGRAEMKGKDEPIDLFAVAWSSSANEQLVEELQGQYDRKLKDAKRRQEEMEEEFENARDQWRTERRRMLDEIEDLEESVEQARDSAKNQISEDLQSEARFQLEEAITARRTMEARLTTAEERWDAERKSLKATIASMQGSVIEAMERANNPARLALTVREQVEARVRDARQDWELEWEGERRRMQAEIDRLKRSGAGSEERKDAARKAILEKLGKGPAGPVSKTVDQVEKEFHEAKIQWEVQRDQLNVKVQRLERELQGGKDEIRTQAFHEVRSQYERKTTENAQNVLRLEMDLKGLQNQLEIERTKSADRIRELEALMPASQEAVRKQVAAELNTEFDAKIEELNRLRARAERRSQDEAEEAESERRRLRKEIAVLEEQLREAKETAYKAKRMGAQ